jgi:hypothetical protein
LWVINWKETTWKNEVKIIFKQILGKWFLKWLRIISNIRFVWYSSYKHGGGGAGEKGKKAEKK